MYEGTWLFGELPFPLRVHISLLLVHHNNQTDPFRFMCSCGWCDCHLQWSLLFFNVNREPPPPTTSPLSPRPASAAMMRAISITSFMAFFILWRGQSLSRQKTITKAVNTLLLPTHTDLFSFSFNKIKVRKRRAWRICTFCASLLFTAARF